MITEAAMEARVLAIIAQGYPREDAEYLAASIGDRPFLLTPDTVCAWYPDRRRVELPVAILTSAATQ